MKYTTITTWFLAALCAVLISAEGARAQRLVLLVDRESGELQATSASEISVDGYSITSPAGRFDADAWVSLNDQGLDIWTEANPKSTQLAELTLESSTLAGGDVISMGSAYTGGPTLPSQEDVGFEYSTGDGVRRQGTVVYTGELPTPKLIVNRATGAASLSNPGGFDVDGYTINSAGGLLLPDNLTGITDFTAANPTTTDITGLNLGGAASFPNSFDLGNIYNSAALAPVAGEDLTLMYSTPEGGVAEGIVEFAGPVNDLTLQVDLISGAASISHQSALVPDVEITGYSILSPSGSLGIEGYTGIGDGDGFTKANPTANALAELSPSGSKAFANGTSVPLGTVLLGIQDLEFRYSTVDGSFAGSVQYVLGGAGPVGDCNGDGALTGDDLACVTTIAERDAVLAAINSLPGDLDGAGGVDFGDFLTFSSNFGDGTKTAYSEGDIDLGGDGPQFGDFLELSANFGQGGAAAVPEPASGTLASFVLLAGLWLRRRRA